MDLVADVRVLEDPRGKVVAFADLTVDGSITITGFRVIFGDEPNSHWVGFPQNQYEKDGEKKHRNVLDVNRRTRGEIAAVILAEYLEVRNRGPQ